MSKSGSLSAGRPSATRNKAATLAKRYDIGLPEHYLETLRTFSQE